MMKMSHTHSFFADSVTRNFNFIVRMRITFYLYLNMLIDFMTKYLDINMFVNFYCLLVNLVTNLIDFNVLTDFRLLIDNLLIDNRRLEH